MELQTAYRFIYNLGWRLFHGSAGAPLPTPTSKVLSFEPHKDTRSDEQAAAAAAGARVRVLGIREGQEGGMAQNRTGRWVGLIVAASAVIVGLYVSGPQFVFKNGSSSGCSCCSSSSDDSSSGSSSSGSSSDTILSIFARESYDWVSSTTPVPVSTSAVLAKLVLADKSTLPAGLEAFLTAAPAVSGDDGTAAGQAVLDVPLRPLQDFLSSRVLEEVRQLCASSSNSPGGGGGCDPNEADPDFGITPLHLAELWGSRELSEYLLSIGADPEIYDIVGRQPRNMTFNAFSANSKKAADARLPPGADPEERCEMPEVVIPLFPGVATATGGGKALSESEQIAAAKEWRDSATAALSEVRRLVSEGEPVVVRNVVPWLVADSSFENIEDNNSNYTSTVQYRSAAQFVEAFGHRPVDVGKVPYAKLFDLAVERTTLKDYVTRAAATVAGAPTGDKELATPNYVFQVDTEACVEARQLLGRIVEAALPSSGENPIVCPPQGGLTGLKSVHYYLGARWTGAPFHIHADALNLVVSGKKRWWVVPPRDAVWSKRHIHEYVKEGKGGPGGGGANDEERPMECVQRDGDLVYVPGNWGHAAMNVEDDTFG